MNFIIVTSAPDAYDYRTTETVVPFGKATLFGRDVRIVRVNAGRFEAEYQRDRYGSGSYLAQLQELSDIALANLVLDAATSEDEEIDHSERVQAGVGWLDEVFPGWVDHINLEVLEMSDVEWCVLGQLAIYRMVEELDYDRADVSYFSWTSGEFDASRFDLKMPMPEESLLSISQSRDRGFAEPLYSDYEGLTKEWKRVINERKVQA